MTAGERWRRVVAVAAVVLGGAGAAASAHADVLHITPSFAPTVHVDPVADTAGALDLRAASLGQQGTELHLHLATAQAWDPSTLDRLGGRSLCVELFRGHQPTPRSRICAAGTNDAPTLRYTHVDPNGHPVRVDTLDASVAHSSPTTLDATFAPVAAGLAPGHYAWRAVAQWQEPGACASVGACVDTTPDAGVIPATSSLLAEPRCFGAAAHTPGRRCRSAALAGKVVPSPADALITPNEFCLDLLRTSVFDVCRFRAAPRRDARTVALIGDSHAAHWRAALNVVASAHRWLGVSITRASCPYSTAPIRAGAAKRRACARWRRATRRWLARHRSVHTVFVSQHNGGIVAPPGANAFKAKVAGVRAALRDLPASVRHVFVIRDVPTNTPRTLGCVAHAFAHHRSTRRCMVRRRDAVKLDPTAVAAAHAGQRRIKVIDMTRYFCGGRTCPPVIGGVLVHKDISHLTETYATTLGPGLLRRANALGA